jgi:hypothetical protein
VCCAPVCDCRALQRSRVGLEVVRMCGLSHSGFSSAEPKCTATVVSAGGGGGSMAVVSDEIKMRTLHVSERD